MNYLPTISRLFADYFKDCSATILRLFRRSFCCPAQVRGGSLILVIVGGVALEAAAKRPGDALRWCARHGMFKGVSIPGDLQRVLNALYLRRKCPVFAFYRLRYIGILPWLKNAVYARKWGYFEEVQKCPGITRTDAQKKPPEG